MSEEYPDLSGHPFNPENVKYELGETVVIKACGGNRAKNLIGISKSINDILQGAPSVARDDDGQTLYGISKKDLRRILGYCNQLEIIADEIK